MLGMAHSKSWFDLQPRHKHTLYQYRQMTFLSGEQMPKCIFITRGIISLSVVSVRLQIMFTSVFEAVWVAIQSRKYETWGERGVLNQTGLDLSCFVPPAERPQGVQDVHSPWPPSW